ncbi:MAG: hypothetical protein J1G01_04030 [Clostridiales bacterium]|nr:hypothetical protein [Clostridiales bacterium]
MKKLGLFRKIGLSAIIALLCLAIMITYFTFVVPPIGSPLAEEAHSVQVTKTDVLTGAETNIDSTCKYGKEFNVPDGATVIAPNGEEVTPEENKVTALQLGNYKVTFGDDVTYDFYVRVTLEEEYFLKVDYNGADIPSYIEYNKSIVLPQARVVYYDENKILQDYPGDYTVEVRSSLKKEPINVKKADNRTAEQRTYEVGPTTGRQFLTYTAQIGGEDGKKTFTQTFTVNVQSNVPNMGNPTLSVSGVQRDVSVNRAVTLPKATATDSYDDNVKIEISVTLEGEPVTNVDIDENGYAYKVKDKVYAPVDFDNDQAMTFYPTEKGSYKITYTAYNDAYDGGTVGKSSTREYYMTVSDLVAPVFKDVNESAIPETWGKVVYKSDGKGGEEVAEGLGGKITFTVPEVVDNNDHMYKEDEDDKNLISLYFRINDAENSKVIVEFSNILADDDDEACQYKTSDSKLYSEDAIFNKNNPFVFDFEKYVKKDADGEEVTSKAGTYTVLFRARDKANNTSSKTYTIKYQDTFKDTAAPTTAEVTVPDYISATEETLTIPYPAYADSDTRPLVDYRVYTDAELGEGDVRFIDVKGGEIADIETREGKKYLVLNSGKNDRNGNSLEKTLLLGDNLYFYVGVTDKVGNFKSNAIDNENLTQEQEGEDERYKSVEAVIKVIATETDKFTFHGDNMTFTKVNAVTDEKYKDKFVAGDYIVASGFNIETASLAMRGYTGFEVTVLAPNDNVISSTLETVSIPDDGQDKATIYVQNIKFLAAVPTEEDEYYKVIVRVFDVNGYNEVYGYKLNGVEKATLNDGTTSATNTVGTTGNVHVAYKLHNEVIKQLPSDGTYYVVRKISGKTYSLMGSEFVAKKQGSYDFQDGYISADDVSSGLFDYENVKHVGMRNGEYGLNVTDESKPIIEVQGVMPTYGALYDEEDADNTTVVLPDVVAYTEHGMAEIEVEITDKNGDKVDYDKETNSFKGKTNGAHTVKYLATYGKTSSQATYIINIGDVEGPEFKVVGGTASKSVTMKVGDTFTFGTMELLQEETGVTITKRLIDPSHEEVTDATVTGSIGLKGDKANNGTTITFKMAGTYEVVYEAKDSVGNPTTQRYTITVVSSGSSTPTTWTTLSTVLIIVAVVLLAGVIVYVVRFRKVKK